MDRREQVQYLNQALLAEMPQYREQAESFPADEISQRRLLRSLMNVRPPMPLSPEFLEVQDALLSTEREEKGVVDGDALPPTAGDPRPAGVLRSLPRLHRQRHPLGGGAPAPGRVRRNHAGPGAS